MEREDRLSRIASFITERGAAGVEEVIARFGVSPATARRDLDALAEQQLVTRTRGGAMANATSGDLPLRYRTARQSVQKRAIARAAVDRIGPGQVIAFNGGTTTTLVAHELGIRATGDPTFADALTTVVTNAVNIANDLVVRPELRIVLTGGAARTRSYELIGPLAMATLPRIHIDTLFLGVNAIDVTAGFFTHHEGEAEVNSALVDSARRTVVVADSSKFATTAFARICSIAAVDAVITDAAADPEGSAALRDQGVEVVLV